MQADPDEFTALVSEYRTRAFHFLLQIVGNREDALDLLQEAFIRLYTKSERRDPSRPVAPWLYRILRNLAIDHLRRRSYRRVYELDEQRDGGAVDAESAPESSELKIQLWKAINELPEAQKEVFILREMHGLSYAEMSEVTGEPVTTVTARLHHARHKLREDLRGYL